MAPRCEQLAYSCFLFLLSDSYLKVPATERLKRDKLQM